MVEQDTAEHINSDLDDLRAIREEIKRRNADLKRIQLEAQRHRRDNHREGDPFWDSAEHTPSTASFGGWRSGSSSDATGTVRDRGVRTEDSVVLPQPVDLDQCQTMADINAWLFHCGVQPFAPFVTLSALMEFTVEQLKFRLESADAAIMVFNRLRRLQLQFQSPPRRSDSVNAGESHLHVALSSLSGCEPSRDVGGLASPLPEGGGRSSPVQPYKRTQVTSPVRPVGPGRGQCTSPVRDLYPPQQRCVASTSPQPRLSGWCLRPPSPAPFHQMGGTASAPVGFSGHAVQGSSQFWPVPVGLPAQAHVPMQPLWHPGYASPSAVTGWRPVHDQAGTARGQRPGSVGPVRPPPLISSSPGNATREPS